MEEEEGEMTGMWEACRELCRSLGQGKKLPGIYEGDPTEDS